MYRENNIEFRIASADAIGKFKISQAHSFLQVCRKEFDFDLSARETVLLSYERMSAWLLQMERAFLDDQSHIPSKAIYALTMDSFTAELHRIEETCLENPRIFSTDIVDFLKVIHRYSVHVMGNALMVALHNTSAKAFVAVAEVLDLYLQHILIAMHEYNNNVILKLSPFICVSKFSLMANAPRFISLKNRAEFFREHDCKGIFLLKNYTSEDLSGSIIQALGTIGIFVKPEERIHETA